MSSLRNRLLLATTIGAGAATGGALALTRRTVSEHRRRPDPEARTLSTAPQRDRVTPVTTGDGLALHVEEVGSPAAPLTVIFAHGWTCTEETWLYQRRDLAGDDLRLVFYDQRGHGRSQEPAPTREAHTTDILGEDLGRIIDVVAPSGPVVLVGHSMGGMTILSLAGSRPELFGPDAVVRGVALLGTSAGGAGVAGLGLPVAMLGLLRRFGPAGAGSVARFVPRLESRRSASALTWAMTRKVAFGSDVPPSLVELMERMIAQSSLATISQFFGAICAYDKLAALPVLADIPVVVIVGDSDVLTPVSNSQAIADALPDAELVVFPGAGHMVMLERPALTTVHLRTLFAQAVAAPPPGRVRAA